MCDKKVGHGAVSSAGRFNECYELDTSKRHGTNCVTHKSKTICKETAFPSFLFHSQRHFLPAILPKKNPSLFIIWVCSYTDCRLIHWSATKTSLWEHTDQTLTRLPSTPIHSIFSLDSWHQHNIFNLFNAPEMLSELQPSGTASATLLQYRLFKSQMCQPVIFFFLCNGVDYPVITNCKKLKKKKKTQAPPNNGHLSNDHSMKTAPCCQSTFKNIQFDKCKYIRSWSLQFEELLFGNGFDSFSAAWNRFNSTLFVLNISTGPSLHTYTDTLCKNIKQKKSFNKTA